MNIRKKIEKLGQERILLLDGAMGAIIQAYKTPSGESLSEKDFRGGDERFKNHPKTLKGCNDILCLTMPDLVLGIHNAYLEAGSDIIETNSFNSTTISLADYGLEDMSYEISKAAAQLARKAADSFYTKEKPRFVAGSLGPTSKSASISPDMDDPGKRAVTWDELEASYYENARGLLDGGADIIIIETIFDTLNAKAAIFAAGRLAEERNIDVPLVISATISEGGRLLSGQTVEAFCVSVLHSNPLALGLNCSFGPEKLKPHIAVISALAPCFVIAYPNAGLPNQNGEYDETPGKMAGHLEAYLKEGLVNIIGGCCGSTPAHISAIAEIAGKHPPRLLPALPSKTLLSGLEVLEINREKGLTEIGERTNVAGSRKFLRLIKNKEYDDAAAIASGMAEAGAAMIDVCMDDSMLDAKSSMTDFLNFSLQFPDIARIPIMIDSSNWDVIEAGLKCLQGKGLVNSISLKEGEEEFIRRAKLARSYGAAIVVMLFDEKGQAVSYERRIAVAERSFKILNNLNFPSPDIVFDPNVLAVATGIPEHDSYAMDFIRTCEWIRDNCPGVQISGGISNLSFSFRGNNVIREAMHAVFLHHAIAHGLSMAIVNIAALVSHDDIEIELRQAVEELILNQYSESHSPTEKLLLLAEKYKEGKPQVKGIKNGITEAISLKPEYENKDTVWNNLTAEERVCDAIIKGNEDYLEADIEKLKVLYKRRMDIIEGPLIKGMKTVGDRFKEGHMFLPQVIRSARVMKRAVDILKPDLEGEKSEKTHTSAGARILIATVKGDVHDIGKNITALVLGCNGYTIIDLGVMVPSEKILEKAREEKVDIIGLSGLITPSLGEMIIVAREMEKQGFTIPILIGGAAASLVHTALKIVPEYSGPVVYVSDASEASGIVNSLLSETGHPLFIQELKKTYAHALERHENIKKSRNTISLEEAHKNRASLSFDIYNNNLKKHFCLKDILEFSPEAENPAHNIIILNNYPPERVIPKIDWTSFLQTWDLAANIYPLAYNKSGLRGEKKMLNKLLDDAKILLEKIIVNRIISLRGVIGFFPAYSDGDDVVIPEHGIRFCFPRNQERKSGSLPNPCLSDFIIPEDLFKREFADSLPESGTNKQVSAAHLGFFALSAGFGLNEGEKLFRSRNDEYGALLLAGLSNSLAEAFSEEVHNRLKAAWGGCGIRPAFGYPACPDHSDKELVFKLLGAKERCGFKLTETFMIIPAASVCGMYMSHPDSCYFGIGLMGEDQLLDWSRRKNITLEEARKRLGGFVGS